MKALINCADPITVCQGLLAKADGMMAVQSDWAKWVRSEVSGHGSDAGVWCDPFAALVFSAWPNAGRRLPRGKQIRPSHSDAGWEVCRSALCVHATNSTTTSSNLSHLDVFILPFKVLLMPFPLHLTSHPFKFAHFISSLAYYCTNLLSYLLSRLFILSFLIHLPSFSVYSFLFCFMVLFLFLWHFRILFPFISYFLFSIHLFFAILHYYFHFITYFSSFLCFRVCYFPTYAFCFQSLQPIELRRAAEHDSHLCRSVCF